MEWQPIGRGAMHELSIPLSGGRVGSKRFVTLEITVVDSGKPVKLQFTGQPARTHRAPRPRDT